MYPKEKILQLIKDHEFVSSEVLKIIETQPKSSQMTLFGNVAEEFMNIGLYYLHLENLQKTSYYFSQSIFWYQKHMQLYCNTSTWGYLPRGYLHLLEMAIILHNKKIIKEILELSPNLKPIVITVIKAQAEHYFLCKSLEWFINGDDHKVDFMLNELSHYAKVFVHCDRALRALIRKERQIFTQAVVDILKQHSATIKRTQGKNGQDIVCVIVVVLVTLAQQRGMGLIWKGVPDNLSELVPSSLKYKN